MKKLWIAGGILILLSGGGWAQPGARCPQCGSPKGEPEVSARQPRRERPDRKALLAEFDRDGDGRLDEDERQAMRQTMMERHRDRWAPFDTNGDGQLDESERQAMREAMKARRQARRPGQPGQLAPRPGESL